MTIEFESPAAAELYARLVEDLEAAFETLYASTELPLLVLPDERAEVRLIVSALTETTALVRVVSWLRTGVNPFEPALMRYLLEQNAAAPLGRFGLDDDGDIFCDVFIPGEAYSRRLVMLAVATVHELAVDATHHLELHWGGHNKPN